MHDHNLKIKSTGPTGMDVACLELDGRDIRCWEASVEIKGDEFIKASLVIAPEVDLNIQVDPKDLTMYAHYEGRKYKLVPVPDEPADTDNQGGE